jgi:hypothetical protein
MCAAGQGDDLVAFRAVLRCSGNEQGWMSYRERKLEEEQHEFFRWYQQVRSG